MDSRDSISNELQLLVNTFTPSPITNTIHPSVVALARVIQAVDLGADENTLEICGQKPDKNYALGEYFIHGGRIRFDLTALSIPEREEFLAYIRNQNKDGEVSANAYNRTGTHGTAGVDASGVPAEIKPGRWASLIDLLPPRRGRHKGIDIPIGGEDSTFDQEGKEKTVKANGKHGHLYTYCKDEVALVGIENASPPNPLFPIKTKNERTNKTHGALGGASDTSPFVAPKAGSTELFDQHSKKGHCPLYPDITPKDAHGEKHKSDGIHNAVSVKVSTAMLKKMRSNKMTAQSLTDSRNCKAFTDDLLIAPKNAISIGENEKASRQQLMHEWYNTTKNNVTTIEDKAKRAQKKWGPFLILGGIAAAIGVLAIPLFVPVGALLAMAGTGTVFGVSMAGGKKYDELLTKETNIQKSTLQKKPAVADTHTPFGSPAKTTKVLIRERPLNAIHRVEHREEAPENTPGSSEYTSPKNAKTQTEETGERQTDPPKSRPF